MRKESVGVVAVDQVVLRQEVRAVARQVLKNVVLQVREQAVTGLVVLEEEGNHSYLKRILLLKLVRPGADTSDIYMTTTTITAGDINKLRQQTGAGMMDCRKALTETNGDFEAAIDYLRKKGQKVAALRGDREAKEGVIIAKTTPDNKTGFIINVSCETDFVSKNAEYVAFANSIMDAVIANDVKSIDELNAVKIGNETVADKLNEQVAKIGEKISVSKFERVEAAYVAAYIHGAYRM